MMKIICVFLFDFCFEYFIFIADFFLDGWEYQLKLRWLRVRHPELILATVEKKKMDFAVLDT